MERMTKMWFQRINMIWFGWSIHLILIWMRSTLYTWDCDSLNNINLQTLHGPCCLGLTKNNSLISCKLSFFFLDMPVKYSIWIISADILHSLSKRTLRWLIVPASAKYLIYWMLWWYVCTGKLSVHTYLNWISKKWKRDSDKTAREMYR